MKVIFLDIDGVINSEVTYNKMKLIYRRTNVINMPYEPEKLGYVKEIIDRTDAKVVLSSDWQQYFTKINGKVVPCDFYGNLLNNELVKFGIELYDLVGLLPDYNHGKEIENYINKHLDEIDSFVVLDDRMSLLYNIPRCNIVLTEFYARFYIDDSRCGLLPEHIDEAVEILNNEKVLKLWKK